MSTDTLLDLHSFYITYLRSSFQSIFDKLKKITTNSGSQSYACEFEDHSYDRDEARACHAMELGDILLQSSYLKLREDDFWSERVALIDHHIENLESTACKRVGFDELRNGHEKCSWIVKLKKERERLRSLLEEKVADWLGAMAPRSPAIVLKRNGTREDSGERGCRVKNRVEESESEPESLLEYESDISM